MGREVTRDVVTDELTADDVRQMAWFIRTSHAEQLLQDRIAREDFAIWVNHSATWLADRVDQAWNYLRQSSERS